MCGINMILRRDGGPAEREDITRMCSAISHRGPDGAGYALLDRGGLAFGHPHAAALLVDFLFSPEGQQFHARQYFLAARKDINWDFGGKTIRGIRLLSAEKWGERYSELIKERDEIFRKKAD